MHGAPVYFCFKTLITSNISGSLFKEDPCRKFMLEHDIKNYFQQFTKT